MSFRIDNADSVCLARIKLLYLIPTAAIIWLPLSLWIGLQAMGNPVRDLRTSWANYKSQHQRTRTL